MGGGGSEEDRSRRASGGESGRRPRAAQRASRSDNIIGLRTLCLTSSSWLRTHSLYWPNEKNTLLRVQRNGASYRALGIYSTTDTMSKYP